jgi:hypothetical protein
MVTVNLVIPDAVAAELNDYAVKCGYANGKQMMIAYLKAELKAARQAALMPPVANVDDVVIG